jgi:cell division protein FtsB
MPSPASAARRQNAELREQALRLKDDPRAIEEAARRDLGLMRPGEIVFIVKDVASGTPSDQQPRR